MADPVISKVTLFMQGSTEDIAANGQPVRAYGFSESYYFPGAVNTALAAMVGGGAGKLAIGGLAPLRAALLPRQAGIIAIRAQLVSPLPVGPSTTRELLLQGGVEDTDMPQVSVLLNVPGVGVTNVKRQIVRCIPDNQVNDGEYSPKQAYDKLMLAFIKGLAGWNFKGKDRTATKVPVVQIDANGVVTTAQPHGMAIGDTVTVGRGRTLALRNSFSGTFKVLKVTDAMTLTLAQYLTPIVIQGGYIRKVTPVWPAIDAGNTTVERSITRKTGRPFSVFHGRQGRKR